MRPVKSARRPSVRATTLLTFQSRIPQLGLLFGTCYETLSITVIKMYIAIKDKLSGSALKRYCFKMTIETCEWWGPKKIITSHIWMKKSQHKHKINKHLNIHTEIAMSKREKSRRIAGLPAQGERKERFPHIRPRNVVSLIIIKIYFKQPQPPHQAVSLQQLSRLHQQELDPQAFRVHRQFGMLGKMVLSVASNPELFSRAIATLHTH
ncbi:hypothetical protein Bhyg_15692 [Pseudolycoriella hygida]|uniref:Uncharacterized protein n=1 Tax=Pseudolycoriella hygida TaxID=35572 RepID=A0A9Q0RV44_9DIPT|nr:hypothetical protein Bhyg_15692 [Pseudolycoriella hygida]